MIIRPDDFRRKEVIKPGEPLGPVDKGLANVIGPNGSHGVVLTDLGWTRLAVMLIKEREKATVSIHTKDITEMPLHAVAQKFDADTGMLEVSVHAQDESETDENDEQENDHDTD